MVFSALHKLQSIYVSEFLLMTKFSYSALEELLSYCKIVIFTYETEWLFMMEEQKKCFNDQ